MDDWLDRFADELGVASLTEDEATALLALARDVARGVERRYAPLSTFLAGMAVARAEDRDAALETVLATASRLIEGQDVPR